MIPTCKCSALPSFLDSLGEMLCYDCASELNFKGCQALKPYVGMPATYCVGSDKHAATVTQVSPSAWKVTIQLDSSKRLDNNGMSESQEYSFARNPHGDKHIFHRPRRVLEPQDALSWRDSRGGRLWLGLRREYYNYSF